MEGRRGSRRTWVRGYFFISHFSYALRRDSCVSAQSELNAVYSKEELGKSHVENWPLYYLARPGFLTAPHFPLTHPAFSLTQPYYQPYGTGATPISIPAPCRYPSYLGTISALKSPESLFYASSLPYPEVR